jgi:TrwC relaxase/Bacterial regulatory proteins, luxR family/Alcohol dehydrogenase GroES-like domain
LIVANDTERFTLGRVPLSYGAGEVTAMSTSVTEWKVGDRVARTFFRDWQSGRFAMSYHHAAFGGSVDGVLREQIVFPKHGLVRLPTSPPESVSVLAVTLDDQRLVEAHEAAAHFAFRELETYSATHVRKQGRLTDRTTGNLVAAARWSGWWKPSGRLARGESFLQPSIAAKVVAEFNRLSQARPAVQDKLLEPLSTREREVSRHLAGGKSNKEIASALGSGRRHGEKSHDQYSHQNGSSRPHASRAPGPGNGVDLKRFLDARPVTSSDGSMCRQTNQIGSIQCGAANRNQSTSVRKGDAGSPAWL